MERLVTISEERTVASVGTTFVHEGVKYMILKRDGTKIHAKKLVNGKAGRGRPRIFDLGDVLPKHETLTENGTTADTPAEVSENGFEAFVLA